MSNTIIRGRKAGLHYPLNNTQQEPLIIDPRNALVVGLRSLWVPFLASGVGHDGTANGGIFNIAPDARVQLEVMDFPATAGERPTWATGQFGVGLSFDGGDELQLASSWISTVTNAHTLAVVGEVSTNPSADAWLYSFMNDGNTTGTNMTALLIGTTNLQFRQIYSGTTANASISRPTAGQPFVAVGRCSSGSSRDVFMHNLDSKAFSTASDSTLLSGAPSSPNRETIAARDFSTGFGGRFTGKVFLCAAWNRALRDDEIYEFMRNPFGFIVPARSRQGFSSVTTVILGKLALAISKKNLTSNAQTLLSLGKTALTLSAKNLVVNVVTLVSLGKTALTISKKNLTANAQALVVLGKKALTISPKNLVSNAKTVLTLGKTALTLSAKNLVANAQTLVTLGKTALTIVGKSLTVAGGATIVNLGKVALAISKKALTVSILQYVTLGKTALTISKKNLTTIVRQYIALGKTALTISKKNLTVQTSGVVVLGTRQLIIGKGGLLINGQRELWRPVTLVRALTHVINRRMWDWKF